MNFRQKHRSNPLQKPRRRAHISRPRHHSSLAPSHRLSQQAQHFPICTNSSRQFATKNKRPSPSAIPSNLKIDSVLSLHSQELEAINSHPTSSMSSFNPTALKQSLPPQSPVVLGEATHEPIAVKPVAAFHPFLGSSGSSLQHAFNPDLSRIQLMHQQSAQRSRKVNSIDMTQNPSSVSGQQLINKSWGIKNILSFLKTQKISQLVVFDTVSQSAVCDYTIVCNVASSKPMHSLAEKVVALGRMNKGHDYHRYSAGTDPDGLWAVAELGHVVVHILTPAGRSSPMFQRVERKLLNNAILLPVAAWDHLIDPWQRQDEELWDAHQKHEIYDWSQIQAKNPQLQGTPPPPGYYVRSSRAPINPSHFDDLSDPEAQDAFNYLDLNEDHMNRMQTMRDMGYHDDDVQLDSSMLSKQSQTAGPIDLVQVEVNTQDVASAVPSSKKRSPSASASSAFSASSPTRSSIFHSSPHTVLSNTYATLQSQKRAGIAANQEDGAATDTSEFWLEPGLDHPSSQPQTESHSLMSIQRSPVVDLNDLNANSSLVSIDFMMLGASNLESNINHRFPPSSEFSQSASSSRSSRISAALNRRASIASNKHATRAGNESDSLTSESSFGSTSPLHMTLEAHNSSHLSNPLMTDQPLFDVTDDSAGMGSSMYLDSTHQPFDQQDQNPSLTNAVTSPKAPVAAEHSIATNSTAGKHLLAFFARRRADQDEVAASFANCTRVEPQQTSSESRQQKQQQQPPTDQLDDDAEFLGNSDTLLAHYINQQQNNQAFDELDVDHDVESYQISKLLAAQPYQRHYRF